MLDPALEYRIPLKGTLQGTLKALKGIVEPQVAKAFGGPRPGEPHGEDDADGLRHQHQERHPLPWDPLPGLYKKKKKGITGSYKASQKCF